MAMDTMPVERAWLDMRRAFKRRPHFAATQRLVKSS